MDQNIVAVVTGSSQGIGREMAQQLACLGYTIVMVARNTPRLSEAVRYVEASCPRPNVIPMPADLSRMAEVRRVGNEVSRRFQKVNLLAHCAAVILPQRELTDEGFEVTFATNVMAPFLLSEMLFESLHRAGPSRLIFFYGGGRGSFDLANLMSDRNYNGWIAYNQSKNADVMISLELANKWSGTGVDVNCVFPGIVKTGILHQIPGYMRALLVPFRPLLRTPSEGAKVAVWAATAPEIGAQSGRLFGSFTGDFRHEFKIPRVARDTGPRQGLIELLSKWTSLAQHATGSR